MMKNPYNGATLTLCSKSIAQLHREKYCKEVIPIRIPNFILPIYKIL